MENRSSIKLNENNSILFEETCVSRGVRTIHYNSGEPLAEIIIESRFADLLIVDPEIIFGDRPEASLSYFIRDVLSKSECPVVIAPYACHSIDEILFFYDGSASSTFAIKQFVYLFPELTDLRITVVQVGDSAKVPVIEKKKLSEFLQTHFSGIGFRVLEEKAGNELLAYLQDKKNIFVVTSAFARSNPLGYFSQSPEALQVKTVNLPLFFATGPWN